MGAVQWGKRLGSTINTRTSGNLWSWSTVGLSGWKITKRTHQSLGKFFARLTQQDSFETGHCKDEYTSPKLEPI